MCRRRRRRGGSWRCRRCSGDPARTCTSGRLDRRVEVLVDAPSRRREWELSGRTSGNTVVNFPGPPEWLGQFVDVTIRRAGPNSVWGEPAVRSLDGARRATVTIVTSANVNAGRCDDRDDHQGADGRSRSPTCPSSSCAISDGQKVLPIWVGVFEANAIALQIENIQTPRPMTHDLLRNIIQDLQAAVEQDRRLRSEGEHLLRAHPSADAGRPGRDRRAAERRDRAGAAHARADPGRRERHRQRQDRRPHQREAGQRSAAAVARVSSTRTTWGNTRCRCSSVAGSVRPTEIWNCQLRAAVESAGRQFP